MKKTSLLPALVLFALGGGQAAWGQYTETDLGIQNPAIMVVDIIGPGVSPSNITYQGSGGSAGTFTGGTGVVGFDSGIILSTGSAAQAAGSTPVTSSVCNGLPGDSDLALLSGNPVTNLFDATSLSFDFIPTNGNITLR